MDKNDLELCMLHNVSEGIENGIIKINYSDIGNRQFITIVNNGKLIYNLYVDPNGYYYFGFDKQNGLPPKAVSLFYYDFSILSLGNNHPFEGHIIAVRSNEKIGLFFAHALDEGPLIYWILKSNKCPFIIDEIWISCDQMDDNCIGFLAYRIGNQWGVAKLWDAFHYGLRTQSPINWKRLFNNNDLSKMTIVPCVYTTREKAIEKLEKKGLKEYHKEYGWHQVFEDKEKLKYYPERFSPDFIRLNLRAYADVVYGCDQQGNIENMGIRNITNMDSFKERVGLVTEGPNKWCYAIPTIGASLEMIKKSIDKFIEYAGEHKDVKFNLMPIGCGEAGYTPEEIAPLFIEGLRLTNIIFPKSFVDVLIK